MTPLGEELEQHEFAYLTTRGRATGRPHRIEIWFVVIDGAVHMISGAGRRADWVMNLAVDPSVDVEIGGVKMAGRAEIVDDPDHAARRRLSERYQGLAVDDPVPAWAAEGTLVRVAPR